MQMLTVTENLGTARRPSSCFAVAAGLRIAR